MVVALSRPNCLDSFCGRKWWLFGNAVSLFCAAPQLLVHELDGRGRRQRWARFDSRHIFLFNGPLKSHLWLSEKEPRAPKIQSLFTFTWVELIITKYTLRYFLVYTGTHEEDYLLTHFLGYFELSGQSNVVTTTQFKAGVAWFAASSLLPLVHLVLLLLFKNLFESQEWLKTNEGALEQDLIHLTTTWNRGRPMIVNIKWFRFKWQFYLSLYISAESPFNYLRPTTREASFEKSAHLGSIFSSLLPTS